MHNKKVDSKTLKFIYSEKATKFCKISTIDLTKGQLISKRNSQAEDSPKTRTNEFVFTSMRRVFVCFLGKSSARKKSFRDYLTFNTTFGIRGHSITTWTR